MSGIKVKNMQAGDPGVGFYLDMSGLQIRNNLAEGAEVGYLNTKIPLVIVVEIYEPTNTTSPYTYPARGSAQHTHAITINNPTVDGGGAENLAIVIPFGSSFYTDPKVIVNVTVTQNSISLVDGFFDTAGTTQYPTVAQGLEVDGNASKIFNFSLVDKP